MDDDEDENIVGMYENGHWVWDEATNGLLFVSDLPPVAVDAILIPTKLPTGAIKFRDDVDLLEQIRYRRRYQRKLEPGQPDVITVQDVKDLVIYTAPVNVLSATLINMLHLPTTERFIKALIFCMQYYLQVEEEMSTRTLQLDTKVRTPICDLLESELRTNLSDLRVLVAKEYCTLLLGGGDTRKFHHMGPAKKSRSLSDKDARLFETLLRMCVQIVWLALGRKAFNQIELEINRLFKTEIFNAVEHTLKTNYIAKMMKEERSVLLGSCYKRGKKLNTRSPLLNEVFCHRDIDYRMMGLGVIKQTRVTPRLMYMYNVVASSEASLSELGIPLGIIGLPRSGFDTMLRPLPITTGTDLKSKSSMVRSVGKMKSRSTATPVKLYKDITIPPRSPDDEYSPPAFPDEPEPPRLCSETQRRRWQKRLHRLTHPQPAAR